MALRFPAPLRPGDRIGVTAPSSGVPPGMRPRLDVAVGLLAERGHKVVVGDCIGGTGHVSAPAVQRARELTAMLTDPTIRAVVPPWGGETAIDLLPCWTGTPSARRSRRGWSATPTSRRCSRR